MVHMFTAILSQILADLFLGYLYSFIGFILGRAFSFRNSIFLFLLGKIIVPALIFDIVASNSDLMAIGITIITFCVSTISSILTQTLHRNKNDNLQQILSYSSGASNCGYILIPIALTLFDDKGLIVYFMAIMGVIFFELLIGSRIVQSSKNLRFSYFKQIGSPAILCFVAGILCQWFNIPLPASFYSITSDLKKLLPILGMMSLGIELSTIRSVKINYNLVCSLFAGKFILYPLLVNVLIVCDQGFWNLYDRDHYNALRLLSFAPLSSSLLVAFRARGYMVNEVATAIISSLLVMPLYLPYMISLSITHP